MAQNSEPFILKFNKYNYKNIIKLEIIMNFLTFLSESPATEEAVIERCIRATSEKYSIKKENGSTHYVLDSGYTITFARGSILTLFKKGIKGPLASAHTFYTDLMKKTNDLLNKIKEDKKVAA